MVGKVGLEPTSLQPYGLQFGYQLPTYRKSRALPTELHPHGMSFYRTLTAYCYDRINGLRRVDNGPPLDGAGEGTRSPTGLTHRFLRPERTANYATPAYL